jgi:hypothetical protein
MQALDFHPLKDHASEANSISWSIFKKNIKKYTPSTYPIGGYMIQPADFILVAILKNPMDLAIARMCGWYRIPLRYAPKIIAVDAVAFYQSEIFGMEKWCVRYVARVQGVELVTRADLFQDQMDHPRAKEEYYKLQIGPLQTLASPIPARHWKRITFFYTTGERLLTARTIDDLSGSDEEREVLWRAMRDQSADPSNRYGSRTEQAIACPSEQAWNELINLFFVTAPEKRE